jgi:hypothetical protein
VRTVSCRKGQRSCRAHNTSSGSEVFLEILLWVRVDRSPWSQGLLPDTSGLTTSDDGCRSFSWVALRVRGDGVWEIYSPEVITVVCFRTDESATAAR